MFQSFAVRNFRCFSGLALTQLERVNLIAGRNNTSKTTLMRIPKLLFEYSGPHVTSSSGSTCSTFAPTPALSTSLTAESIAS